MLQNYNRKFSSYKVLTNRQLMKTSLTQKKMPVATSQNSGHGRLPEQSLTKARDYRVKETIPTEFHDESHN